ALAGFLVDVDHLAAAAGLGNAEDDITDFNLAPRILLKRLAASNDDIGAEAGDGDGSVQARVKVVKRRQRGEQKGKPVGKPDQLVAGNSVILADLAHVGRLAHQPAFSAQ